MNKLEFINQLKKRLNFLPEEELQERISFYVEAIDDRIEEGYEEEYAVYKAGSIDDIVLEITQDTPFTKILKEKVKPKKNLSPLGLTLVILGSPVWFSLLVGFIAVVFSLYVAFWAVVISLWAVLVAFVVSSVAGIVVGLIFALVGYGVPGIALVCCCVFLFGISIFTYYACKYATIGAIFIIKKLALATKIMLVKEKA